MTINKNLNGEELTVAVIGRLDTTTAPQLENELQGELGSVSALVLDFAELQYISSAGLRVLLATHKAMMKKGGSLIIRNANEAIMEVFDVTGFVDILNIE